jgi:C-terminal processing protease CtpA/Prc
MQRVIAARAVAALIVLGWLAGAEAAESGNRVFDRTVDIVKERFYAPANIGAFDAAVTATIARLPQLATAGPGLPVTREAVDAVLASLNASHTGRYVQDQLDYYELADVFRFALRRDMRRLFPPDGEVTYDGIGIATRDIDGKVFITDVYDGGPAARAAIKPGDEILSVDGAPFAEIGSFRGKAGRLAELNLLRTADGEPITVAVRVEKLQPGDAFLRAISDSVQVIQRGNRKIGVVKLWSYTRSEVTDILYHELGGGRLKDVDGLIVDLRSRWGGAPADAAETFVGGTADMRLVDRDGKESMENVRWHKPVVAIIDAGTRSGMEILAYSLKKNGIPLIGTETAGDVLAATGFLLPDDSLLVLAVDDVFVDGERLEGHPIKPDIAVPFDVRYADGRDPQLDAALAAMAERLAGGGSD